MIKTIIPISLLIGSLNNLYASYEAKIVVNNLKLYNDANSNAKVIDNKNRDDLLKIEYCNKYGWCKIENKNLYVKQYAIKKIASKEEIKKETIKQEKKAIDTKKDGTKNINYKKGLVAFKNKNFESSFNIFANLLNNYPQNEKIAYYYGRSAFELKKYEFAFTAFDQVLITNPSNHRARLEYARTLFMMKAYKEAKEEFNKVLASPIPKEVRQNVEKFISMIKKTEKGYILNKVAIFGFGWDDNVDNNTYEDITLLNGLPLSNNTNKRKDYNFKTILVGNLIVPSKVNKKVSWESTAVGYMQEQKKYHENDIALISLSSGAGYTNQKYKNLASLTYDHVWVDGDQTIYMYGVANKFKYKPTKSSTLVFDIKYKKKKMIKLVDRDRSANIKELGLTYSFPIYKKDTLKLYTAYITDRKTNGTRVDVSKNTREYKISYDKNIFNLDFTLGYEIEKTNYKEASFFLPKREDDKRNTSLRIAKKLSKTKILSLELNDIDTKSNINTYTYDKKTANLNYTLVF